MKAVLIILLFSATALCGCAMFSSWTAIPPPGGCDRCHTVAISTNWRATLKPVQLSREDGTPPWQQEESVNSSVESGSEQQLLSDERCFRCHREPNATHKERRGRYHHR